MDEDTDMNKIQTVPFDTKGNGPNITYKVFDVDSLGHKLLKPEVFLKIDSSKWLPVDEVITNSPKFKKELLEYFDSMSEEDREAHNSEHCWG